VLLARFCAAFKEGMPAMLSRPRGNLDMCSTLLGGGAAGLPESHKELCAVCEMCMRYQGQCEMCMRYQCEMYEIPGTSVKCVWDTRAGGWEPPVMQTWFLWQKQGLRPFGHCLLCQLTAYAVEVAKSISTHFYAQADSKFYGWLVFVCLSHVFRFCYSF
jgi:hypothetical protein